MKKIISSAVCCMFCLCTFAQIQMGLSITPALPQSNDNVIVNARVALMDGCYKFDSTLTINGNSIFIHACYVYGWGSAGSFWRDTAYYSLGSLADGTYNILYQVHATLDEKDTFCASYSLVDTEAMTFTVGATSIAEPVADIAVLLNRNRILIRLEHDAVSGINVLDVSGRQVYGKQGYGLHTGNTYWDLDVPDLPAGLYFYQLQVGDRVKVLKWIQP